MRFRAASATMLLVVVSLAAAMPAEATPPPEPDLGAGIDPYASYDAQDTCSPTVKPGTDMLRDLLLKTYPQSRDLGIVRACNIGSTSEHKEGRAFDWGVRITVASEKAAAQEVLAWLLKTDEYGNKHAMARRMGIMYMIWNDQIWGSYRASEGWREYTGSNPHTDHIHFSLSWDGAMARTSYWKWYGGDRSAPDTDATLSGTAGDNGWWRGAVTARLSVSDSGGSGVDWTKYRVDLGSWKTYSGAFSVGGQGSHRLDYYSKDNAGNVETAETRNFKIDSQPPVTTMAHGSPSYTGSRLHVSSATRFTLDADDATSGVASSTWTWRGASKAYAGAFSLAGSDGAATLSWRSEDKAGNLEASKTADVYLDNTPPSLSLAAPEEGALIVGALAPVDVAPGASDGGSGVARVEFWVDGVKRATDTAPPFQWAWATADEAVGSHVLQVRAVDRVGNTATLQREVWTVPSSPAGALASLAKVQELVQQEAERVQRLAQVPPDPAEVQQELGGLVQDVQDEVPAVPPKPYVPGAPALPV